MRAGMWGFRGRRAPSRVTGVHTSSPSPASDTKIGASEAGSSEAGVIESSSAGGHAASWAARVRSLMACS
jgi:hypothetical protein